MSGWRPADSADRHLIYGNTIRCYEHWLYFFCKSMQIAQILGKREHHRVDAGSVRFDELFSNICSTADHMHTTTGSRQHITREGVRERGYQYVFGKKSADLEEPITAGDSRIFAHSPGQLKQ